MFGSLLAKEIKSNVISMRYIAAIILLLVSIMGVAYTYGNIFDTERSEYLREQAHRNDVLEQSAHYNRMNVLIAPVRPPNTMSVLFGDQGSDPADNPFFQDFIHKLNHGFDLIDILVYVMSIIAVVMAYDAVSGEREQGTLRVLSAFSVPRSSLLITKLLAGLSVILMGLAIAFAVALTYLLTAGQLPWGLEEWVSLLIILVFSLVYFCCFYSFGLLASSLASRSTSSIIIAFLIWIGFIFIVPNMSPFVASQLYSVPAVEKINAQLRSIYDTERDDLGRKFVREVNAWYEKMYPDEYMQIRSLGDDELKALMVRDETIRNFYQKYRSSIDSVWMHANEIQRNKGMAIQAALDNKMARQLNLAEIISSFSPSADFTYILEAMSATGYTGYQHFMKLRSNYYLVFSDYIAKKYNALRENDPQFTAEDFIDVSDRPRFVFTSMTVADRLRAAWIHMIALLLFSCAAFAVAYVALLKYDIR